MGRTLLSPTALIKQEKEQWTDYRRALRKEDRAVFDGLFAKVLNHSGEIACAEKIYPLEGMLVSILIEQEKQISELSQRILVLEGATRHGREAEVKVSDRDPRLPDSQPFSAAVLPLS